MLKKIFKKNKNLWYFFVSTFESISTDDLLLYTHIAILLLTGMVYPTPQGSVWHLDNSNSM